MKNLGIKISLILNYIVFAMLLNSVGAVILQVQLSFDVSKADASLLEGFKDLPIAFVSFFIASFLPRIGIKKSMLICLGLMTLICFSIPSIADEFWYFKLLFALIGITFAVIKVGTFSTIGLITENDKEHSSLMSLIEGFFMIGVLVGNLVFSIFIDDNNSGSTGWLNIYYFLGALCLVAFGLLFISKLNESAASTPDKSDADNFKEMLRLFIKPLVLVFVLAAFLFVLIEQSFQTWTPTFYNDVLHVSNTMSIQAGAILAGAFAIGRLLAGGFLRKISWLPFTITCLLLLTICIVSVLPLAKNVTITDDTTWLNAPIAAYLFPIMGIFLAPIYPTINSVILNALPKNLHSSMSGLIVVFSALGGTTGSMVTGNVFEHFDGATAFYMSLIPIALLTITLFFLNNWAKKTNEK